MERKEFIKTCGLALLGGTMLSGFLPGCASANYFAQVSTTDHQITVRKTEFIRVEKNKSIQRKYLLIKSDQYAFPICVYKIGEEHYSALLMKCTHKGCELEPQGDYLICPCHGSEFSNKGAVQNPPAEENLKAFQITTDDENIYLQL